MNAQQPDMTQFAGADSAARGIDISVGKTTIDLHSTDTTVSGQSGMATAMANLTGKLSGDIEPEMKQPEFSQPNRAQRRAMDRKAGKPTASQRLNERAQTQQRLNNFYKHNTMWDDLSNVFNNCAQLVTTSLTSVLQDLNDPAIRQFLIPENVGDIETALRGLTSDSENLSVTLAEIHSRHRDRSGTTRNQDETSRAHLIMNDYMAWQQRYDALIKPNFAYLVEQIGLSANRAEQALKALQAQAQDQAQDPTVVTDVVAKEVAA